MANVFITGNSSGLGLGLTQYNLQQGWQVYGLSRRGCPLQAENLHDIHADLTDFEQLPQQLEQLLAGVSQLDLVILNAGMLGQIRELHQTSLTDIQQLMDINVWANKVVMDWLHQQGLAIKQIVMISSGAAVFGNKGWSGYSLSKATLNMLAKLYAHEFPNTQINALAPGLIDSQMMDYLCSEQIDHEQFPALQRLQEARGTDVMPGPIEAAERVMQAIEQLPLKSTSGSYIDMRELLHLAFSAR